MSPAPPTHVTRFIAGNFQFAPANVYLISTLMLPISHARGSEIVAGRLATLLVTPGEEALTGRPERPLVLDRLLEVMLIEALRDQSPRIGEGGRDFWVASRTQKSGVRLA